METNIFLLSWLFISTNTEAITLPVSDSEKEFLVLTVEYRTNIQVAVSSNVIGRVKSTLRFDGTNWVPGPLVPKPLILPPLPPGVRVPKAAALTPYSPSAPKAPMPRFAIPTMPPPLPDAAMLEKERQAREKVANDKRDPKRRS